MSQTENNDDMFANQELADVISTDVEIISTEVNVKDENFTKNDVRGNFFAQFNRNSVSVGVRLPNEPENYRFVEGILLPPTPNLPSGNPYLPPKEIISSPVSEVSSCPSLVTTNKPVTPPRMPTVRPTMPQLLRPLQPIMLRKSFTVPSSLQDRNSQNSSAFSASQNSQGISASQNSLGISASQNSLALTASQNNNASSQNSIKLAVKNENSKRNVGTKRKIMDVDSYVKFLLKEDKLDPGVNILLYEDAYVSL